MNRLRLDTPYGKFLRSSAWRKTRKRVLDRNQGLCVICKKSAEEIHHHDYLDEIVEGTRDDLLVSLCEDCHRRIEFDGREKRVDLNEKKEVFDELKAIHERLRRDGVHVIWSKTLHRKKPVYQLTFRENYWQANFVTIYSLAHVLLWAMRREYNLHNTAGYMSKIDKEGAKLTFKENKRIAALVKIESDTCFVYLKSLDISIPWEAFDDLLNKPFNKSRGEKLIQYEITELNPTSR